MSTDNIEAELNDVDLDLDPEEEMKRIEALEKEAAEGEEKEGEESEGEEKEEKSEGEESEGEEKEEKAEGEESEGEEKEEKAEGEVEEDPAKVLADLRAERERLQQQLEQMSSSSQADRRRLELIEQNLLLKDQQKQPEPEPAPEGPTPEQIVAHLDQRIAAVDAALTEAENNDPSQAPALRTQLRQLERYYNNFVSQQQLLAQQGPRPEEVIQQAVQETNQRNAFSSTRDYITQEFPILDANNEYFDEGLRDQVHKIYNPMIASGANPQEALAEAVLLVTRAHGVEPASVLRQQYYEQEQQTLAAQEAEAQKAVAKQNSTARKSEAVKKNVAAEGATPPSLSEVGAAGSSKGIMDKYDFGSMSINDVMRMSDDELERVEGVLAMHGD